MGFDSLGDRMKKYEKAETGRRFMSLLPVVARIDGKAFHTWTKGLDKPFDRDFIEIMQMTTKRLVEETGACIGYTQSDEISLVFYSDNPESQIFFDGKIFKMTSVLASMTTAYFKDSLSKKLDELFNFSAEDDPEIYKDSDKRLDKFINKPSALFDCRVWQMPTKREVVNYLIWREMDAVRNSIQSAGQANFSHKELHHKNQSEIQEMLFQEKGINWNDYRPCEKRGTYFSKQTSERRFTAEEIDKLPPKHEAKTNPDLVVVRHDVEELDAPRLTQVINPVDIIFFGGKPAYELKPTKV